MYLYLVGESGMKNRSRLDITTMILESARTGIPKSKIMFEAYLSYSQLVEYLNYLDQNNLLEYETNTHLYKLTGKGLRVLNISKEMNELLVLPQSRKALA